MPADFVISARGKGYSATIYRVVPENVDAASKAIMDALFLEAPAHVQTVGVGVHGRRPDQFTILAEDSAALDRAREALEVIKRVAARVLGDSP